MNRVFQLFSHFKKKIAGQKAAAKKTDHVNTEKTDGAEKEIDYLMLINRTHPAPDGLEKKLDIIIVNNSLG